MKRDFELLLPGQNIIAEQPLATPIFNSTSEG